MVPWEHHTCFRKYVTDKSPRCLSVIFYLLCKFSLHQWLIFSFTMLHRRWCPRQINLKITNHHLLMWLRYYPVCFNRIWEILSWPLVNIFAQWTVQCCRRTWLTICKKNKDIINMTKKTHSFKVVWTSWIVEWWQEIRGRGGNNKGPCPELIQGCCYHSIWHASEPRGHQEYPGVDPGIISFTFHPLAG